MSANASSSSGSGNDISISTNELTKIENALVMVRESIDSEAAASNPEAQKIIEAIVEAEQIISSKLDVKGTETTSSNTGGGYQGAAPKPMAH